MNIDSVLRKIRYLLSFAHDNDMLVIFTKLEYEPDYSDAGLLVKEIAPQIVDMGSYVKGAWDSQIFDLPERGSDDIIIAKTRYDPFVNTRFEDILKENHVTHLIVAGLLTNVCVESCVRSAFDRDISITVIRDATSTYSRPIHEASLATLQKHFAHVVSYQELLKDSKVKQSKANHLNRV